MASTNLLETNTVSLNELLSNGKTYTVPKFQRDYAWTEDEWETLWEDIEALNSSEQPHYMGTIVLQTQDSRHFLIVDGQQRLATLTIVILSCIKLIQKLIDSGVDVEANSERRDILMATYIGAKDAASLNYSNKLNLSPQDNPFFSSTLVRLREPLNPKRLVSNEAMLWLASQFFSEKLSEYFGESLSGVAIAEFATRTLAEKLVFIQITVADQLNAYTVFETLNARGVSLTTSDLLKNYLLSLMSESETDQNIAVEQWKRLIETTTASKFPQFLLYFWNGRNKSIRAAALFKTLRRSVTTKEQAFALLDNLEQASGVYVGLKDPEDAIWNDSLEIQRNIQHLNLFGVNSCFPLLMNAYQFCSLKEFGKILRACVVISFRANVIANQSTNRQGDAYNAAALKLFQSQAGNSREIIRELAALYLSDEEFRSAFSTKSISVRGTKKKRLVRYILLSLESQSTGRDQLDLAASVTIEHIMPENLSDEWDIDLEEHQNFVYRLGNYTLLRGKPNRHAGNSSFQNKLAIYAQSEFELTQQLTSDAWGKDEIRARQNLLARQATGIWRVAQLD